MDKIKIKREVIVKTIVTPKFKEQVERDINSEIELTNTQIGSLELEIQNLKKQLEHFQTQFNHEAQIHTNKALIEITSSLEQLVAFQQDLIKQLNNIDSAKPGDMVITGRLENYAELKIGDNLLEKFNGAVIIVKDGIIERIEG